jgi:predicted ATPase/DNA-binding XRE family transcriptional regulator
MTVIPRVLRCRRLLDRHELGTPAVAHGSFGDLLRTHRLRLALTQEGVAERAGLSVHAIQKLERGTTHPYRDTTNRLVLALGLSDQDEAEFRALGEPVARQRRDELTASTPDIHLAQSDLPTALTSFVGREREIVEVGALLGSARLITLTGVGGCGKTRLALEVARRCAAQFDDGVALVELASLPDASLVTQAIGSTLGIREAPTQPLLTTLCGVLKQRQLLLVLDNCEHLLDTCARVADTLLRACPGLTILATSREALGLTGEVSWRVPSLPQPSLHPLPPMEQLAEFAAIRLFLERANSAHPPFVMTAHNAAAIAQVCQRLDGIPLILELAAVRVRSMSIEELAARLDQRFRLLTGGSRTALPRQQTLRATIDWSYQLLEPAERLLFARLSVFAGSWTLDAAEAVCGGRGVAPEDVVDLVLRLVDKSLVTPTEETAPAQRYELLQTLRQYGREQLLAIGDADALHDQHAAHFLALAEHTESAQSQLDASGWTDRLAPEQADLDAALEWFVGQVDTDQALRLASVLWHLWDVHAFFTEGRRRIATLLALPGADAPTLGRARVLNGAGVLALSQHDVPSARGLLRESLALYQLHQDDRGVAWVLIHLSWLCLDIARRKAARRFLRDALSRCERLDEQHGIARCQNLLGYLAWGEGDLSTSRDLHLQSLALNRKLGDRWGTAWALHRLSVTLLHLAEQGAVEASSVRPLIEEELAIWQELGERRHLGFALCDLGTVATLERSFELACRWLAESHAIFAELNDRHGGIWVLGAYQLLLATAGDLESALCIRSSMYALVDARPNRAPVPFLQRQQRFERHLLLARNVLGTDVVAMAWAEGQSMSLPEAIAYAQRASASAAREAVLAD